MPPTLLLIKNQTKLTLTIALTLTDTVMQTNKTNPDIIYTTLCKMQQIYYIHNGPNNVVHMQRISYIHNVVYYATDLLYSQRCADATNILYTQRRQMATLDAPKVLLLTNKTKLTLTIALTLTDTVMVIFLCAFCRHQ